MRLENNVELYLDKDKKNATMLKRGTGEIFNFEIDTNGLDFINNISIKGQLASSYQKNDSIIEGLSSLKLIDSESNIIQQNTSVNRCQIQWLKDTEINPTYFYENIQNSRIAIVGLGGIGSWLGLQLCAIGARNIKLCDGDIVDSSNINKQFYKKEDIGKNKAQCLKNELSSRFDNLDLVTIEQFINTEEELNHYFNDIDFLFIAADMPSREKAASFFSKWCYLNNKTHFICGGYSGHTSSLGVTVIPHKTPCWECYIIDVNKKTSDIFENKQLIAKGENVGSSILPMVMTAANATVMEFIRVISGKRPIFAGKHYDLLSEDWKIKKRSFKTNKHCVCCKNKINFINKERMSNETILHY